VPARELAERRGVAGFREREFCGDQELACLEGGGVEALEEISPFFPAAMKVAPSASAQAGSSAAGSASAQLPPKVPRLRIAGCAMCGIAAATSGRCRAMSAERSIST